jgi:hypothetical protein
VSLYRFIIPYVVEFVKGKEKKSEEGRGKREEGRRWWTAAVPPIRPQAKGLREAFSKLHHAVSQRATTRTTKKALRYCAGLSLCEQSKILTPFLYGCKF